MLEDAGREAPEGCLTQQQELHSQLGSLLQFLLLSQLLPPLSLLFLLVCEAADTLFEPLHHSS